MGKMKFLSKPQHCIKCGKLKTNMDEKDTCTDCLHPNPRLKENRDKPPYPKRKMDGVAKKKWGKKKTPMTKRAAIGGFILGLIQGCGLIAIIFIGA